MAGVTHERPTCESCGQEMKRVDSVPNEGGVNFTYQCMAGTCGNNKTIIVLDDLGLGQKRG